MAPRLRRRSRMPSTPSIVTTGEAIDSPRARSGVRQRVGRNARAHAARRAATERRRDDAPCSSSSSTPAFARTPFARPATRFSRSSISRTAAACRASYVARNGIEIRLDAVERVGEILDARRAGRRDVSVRRSLRPEGSRCVERDALTPRRRGCPRARRCAGRGRRPHRRSRPPHRRHAAAADRAAAADDDARRRPPTRRAQTPIEAGLIEIRAQVTLTVAIK